MTDVLAPPLPSASQQTVAQPVVEPLGEGMAFVHSGRTGYIQLSPEANAIVPVELRRPDGRYDAPDHVAAAMIAFPDRFRPWEIDRAWGIVRQRFPVAFKALTHPDVSTRPVSTDQSALAGAALAAFTAHETAPEPRRPQAGLRPIAPDVSPRPPGGVRVR